MQTVETTLGSVATYINGRAFKPSEWKTSGLPIIRIQNLTSSKEKYNYSDEQHEEKYRVKKGDLLFAWSASLGAHIWNGSDAWLNQHIFRVVPHDNINKMYLYYFLLNVIADLYAKTHGSGMVHITKTPFLNTKILVPPLAEQERIVAKIEELFSQLDAATAELKNAKEKINIYRQSVLKEAFSQYAFAHKELSDFIEKPQYGTSKKCDYCSGNQYTAVYRIPNIDYHVGGINHSDIKRAIFSEEELSSLQLQKGDILFIRSNGSLGLVGRAAIITESDIHGVFAGYLIRIRVKDKNALLPKYLLYALSTHEARAYIEQTAKSTSGVNNINSKEIQKLAIPFCSPNLQQLVVERIEANLPLCDSIDNSVDKAIQQATSLRQNVLKLAFEGKL